MELNTMYIVGLMADCHDLSFLTFSSYLQALGKTFPADYPGMITSDRYLFAQPFKKYVFLQDADRCLYTVIYFFQVFQSCTKSLADGLMSQTNA